MAPLFFYPHMIKYILYLHLWLALIAFLLTIECVLFFSIPLENYPFSFFSAAATLFTYNAHTLFAIYSKKKTTELTNWARKHYVSVACTAAAGLVWSMYICINHFSLYQWIVLLCTGCLWLFYENYIVRVNKKNIKTIPNYTFIKSIVLAIVWTIITSILPLTRSDFGLLSQSDALLFIGVRFCLFAFITQLFEYRDLYTEKNGIKNNYLSDKTIGYTNLTLYCNLFACIIFLQLIFIDVHILFKLATLLQLSALIFFIRIKNIVTVTSSMILWDGILILSPLICIPVIYS